MAWEWGRLIGRSRGLVDDLLMILAGLLPVAASSFLAPWAGLPVLVVVIAALNRFSRDRDVTPIWTAAGLAWIVLPTIGFAWLRSDPEAGRETVLWVLVLVWSVDIAAYAAGKTLGGPRLAPRISPKKTWAGLLGGVAGALLVGLASGLIVGSPRWGSMALASGALAIVEQIGDIAESYAKRRFGAKDSSSLIPGHGGLLDRLDGLLAVVAVVVIVRLVTGGSVLTWR
jgi:phosphatidate cytidylyltransferase